MTETLRLRVTLLTGRTIEQGVGKELGKTSREYIDIASSCFIDPKDLESLGIKEGSNVFVSTEHGSAVFKAMESSRGPHPGAIYIPYGPWANAIVDPETDGIGMPSLKGIPSEIRPAAGQPVLSLRELLRKQFRKD